MVRGVVSTGLVLLSTVLGAAPGAATEGDPEILRLASGRELVLDRGRLRPGESGSLLQEAERFLMRGRLDLAEDNRRAVSDRGDPALADAAASLSRRIDEVERSSVVVLKNGRSLKGRLRAKIRSDQLGLPAREEIPLWRIEKIEAEYVISYSLVTKTFYLLTLLDIRFRGQPPAKTTITEEILLEVEADDGSVIAAPLGYPYELLRKELMGDRVAEVVQDRIGMVIVYSALQDGAPSEPDGRE